MENLVDDTIQLQMIKKTRETPRLCSQRLTNFRHENELISWEACGSRAVEGDSDLPWRAGQSWDLLYTRCQKKKLQIAKY